MYNHITKISASVVAIFIIATLSYMDSPSVYWVGLSNIFSLFFLGNAIRIIQGKLLTPFLLISVCLYVFHSGHLWLAFFNINANDFLTSFGLEYQTTNSAYIVHTYSEITILLTLFMETGVLFLKKCKSQDMVYTGEQICATKTFKNGFILLYVAAMFFELKRAISVAATSYGEGYHYDGSSEMFIANAVDALLLFFLYINRGRKKEFRFYLMLQLFRTLFIMFFVGNRGSSVIYLLVTLFVVSTYSYLSLDKKKMRNIIISMFAFFLVALPFISATRGGSRDKIAVTEFVNDNNPLESFLIEFGGTAGNVFLTKDFVNIIGPSYGFQIIGTTLTIVPASTYIFGDIITKNVSIAGMLNEYNNQQGLGGSLISQLYFNFYGTFFLYVSIILVALLCVMCSNNLMRGCNTIYSTFIFLCLFSGLMTFVRGEWYDVVSQIKISIYIALLIYITRNNLIIKYKK